MSKFRVALFVESSLGYGRGLLRGISEYSRHCGPWSFYMRPGDLLQRVPDLAEWGAHGIIARIWSPGVEKAILELGLPVIALDLNRDQLAPDQPLSQISELCPDGVLAGRMAADHLLERGLRQFAFVGAFDDPLWSTRREEGSRAQFEKEGLPCETYPLPKARSGRQWGKEQQKLGRWLSRLPRPLGVVACDDDHGRQVLEACRAVSLLVPGDVAFVGVDNDDLLCELSDPPLSSVALDAKRAGYEAAALLDRLMQGKVRAPRRILVKPAGVVARRSTDVFALEDGEVSLALRFIQDNASRGIGVSEVVRHVAISRRNLELRFHRTLGRTIHDELIRCRLTRAQLLLRGSQQNLAEVALVAGFGSSCHMHRVFRRCVGCTPREWAQANSK